MKSLRNELITFWLGLVSGIAGIFSGPLIVYLMRERLAEISAESPGGAAMVRGFDYLMLLAFPGYGFCIVVLSVVGLKLCRRFSSSRMA